MPPDRQRHTAVVARLGRSTSFETILRRYEFTDPVLWRIAEIIHEADLDDERYDAPEALGLDITLRGLSMCLTGDSGSDRISACARSGLGRGPIRPLLLLLGYY